MPRCESHGDTRFINRHLRRRMRPRLRQALTLGLTQLSAGTARRLPSRGILLRGLGAAAVAIPLATETYSRAPPTWRAQTLPPLRVEAGVQSLAIVLPGAGGPDANVERIVRALRQRDGKGTAVMYDWSSFVGDSLRAPYNAQRVGEHLGTEVARLAGLRRLHVVGVSVGAFAADALLDTLARLRPGAVFTKVSFLDPFTARGIAGLARPGSAYGLGKFGSSADEAECIFNTDDPVPSTSRPLRLAANLDITDAAARTNFVPLPGDSLHSWPAAWFGLTGAWPGTLPPRGEVRKVP